VNPEKPGAITLDLAGVDALALFGSADANLRALERHYAVTLGARGESLSVTGPAPAVGAAAAAL
jgi:phosphate starvation-inducible protein PhoH